MAGAGRAGAAGAHLGVTQRRRGSVPAAGARRPAGLTDSGRTGCGPTSNGPTDAELPSNGLTGNGGPMNENTTTPQPPIRVMLVDDQHLLRMGFRLILEGEDDLEVVAEAADGIEATDTMEALGQNGPDVVLMDVRMPRMDGIEATAQIVKRWCETKVIILTTFDLDEYAFSGLQAGASAFLLKDVEPEALVDAVRVVASGDAVVAPRI